MKYLVYTVFVLSFLTCAEEQTTMEAVPLPPNDTSKATTENVVLVNKEIYKDRVLGLLVGSAIGDAMGSPVEMWTPQAINFRYGFVDQFIPNVRSASAEGPWGSNLMAGTGTDDTRWKQLMGVYFLGLQKDELPEPKTFAIFIQDAYEDVKKEIIQNDGLAPQHLETSTRYLQWLQEWTKVAAAYESNNIDQYASAVAKFYGGEMACGGMLYAPMFGLLYPQQPKAAYRNAWSLSLFDIGYAKDITAMTAALTAAAFASTDSLTTILNIHYEVDEERMADSRLIGRIVNTTYERALRDYYESLQIEIKDMEETILPFYFKSQPQRYHQLIHLYRAMEPQLQAIPFHAGEIYMISLYALLYAEGNFMDAMVFITNFGRDNDTVAAVVGSILGAYVGYEKLPKNLAEQVVAVQKKQLGIDIHILAEQLTDKYAPTQ